MTAALLDGFAGDVLFAAGWVLVALVVVLFLVDARARARRSALGRWLLDHRTVLVGLVAVGCWLIAARWWCPQLLVLAAVATVVQLVVMGPGGGLARARAELDREQTPTADPTKDTQR